MIGGEDLGANLQGLAENAKKNLEAGLDNLNVDQLAGQLNRLPFSLPFCVFWPD